MPRRLFVPSQNRLALSCEYVPDAPAKTNDPAVNAVAVPLPPRATDNVPVVPATIGKPVALVSVAADGVPMLGVVSVGDVASTTAPLPVEVVAPVPPLVTGSVPLTCVVRPILPHTGATPTPPEIRALPTAALDSFDSVDAALAYKRSPVE